MYHLQTIPWTGYHIILMVRSSPSFALVLATIIRRRPSTVYAISIVPSTVYVISVAPSTIYAIPVAPSTIYTIPVAPSTTKYHFNQNSSFSPFLYFFLLFIKSHWFPPSAHFDNSSFPHLLQFHIFSFLQFHKFPFTLNHYFLIFSLTFNC